MSTFHTTHRLIHILDAEVPEGLHQLVPVNGGVVVAHGLSPCQLRSWGQSSVGLGNGNQCSVTATLANVKVEVERPRYNPAPAPAAAVNQWRNMRNRYCWLGWLLLPGRL